jgi:uncharacterized protein (TIGR02646 family)
MRYVDRGPCPPDLDPTNPCAEVKAERAKATHALGAVDLGAHKGIKKYKFDFKEHGRARSHLDAVFQSKCAYCEAPLEVSADPEVEHFRPKGAVWINGHNRKPAYYWLATDWTNLTLCCPVCNKRRSREVAHDLIDDRGKGTHFPLLDEARRAKKADEERHETPLLLNPCEERHPERFFDFDRDGYIRVNMARSPFEQAVARATIEVFGLDRDRLRRARGAAIQNALVHVTHLAECIDDWLRHPTAAQAQTFEVRTATALRELRMRVRRAEPFSAAVRQVVLAELSELVGMPVPESLLDEEAP